jgi:hypothetical protein
MGGKGVYSNLAFLLRVRAFVCSALFQKVVSQRRVAKESHKRGGVQRPPPHPRPFWPKLARGCVKGTGEGGRGKRAAALFCAAAAGAFFPDTAVGGSGWRANGTALLPRGRRFLCKECVWMSVRAYGHEGGGHRFG